MAWKKSNCNGKKIQKMEPPKMTSKLDWELLIKRYQHSKAFPRFQRRKKNQISAGN